MTCYTACIEQHEHIAKCARQAIAAEVFPGCVIGLVRQGSACAILPFGALTYESGSPAVREDTIYDLASITKSVPVASLVAIFAAEGKLELGDEVRKYIPELQNDFGATIEDLLRYRVRGPRMSTLAFLSAGALERHLLECGFDAPLGEPAYANFPAFLLGIVLERAAGEPLNVLAREILFDPLAMATTTFDVGERISHIAPTEVVEGVEIRGVVHDESARVFAEAGRAVGHAGLFSSAPDLLKFLEALLQGKFPTVVEAAETGLGWQVNEAWMGDSRGAARFGKTGFTGTSIAVDPRRGIGLVILSNRTFSVRPPDSSAINAFRRDIAAIVFGS